MKYKHDTECQWFGDNDHACGKPVVDGYSYCEEHWDLVYQAGTALHRRHKDIRVANAVWDMQSLIDEAVAELEAEGEF